MRSAGFWESVDSAWVEAQTSSPPPRPRPGRSSSDEPPWIKVLEEAPLPFTLLPEAMLARQAGRQVPHPRRPGHVERPSHFVTDLAPSLAWQTHGARGRAAPRRGAEQTTLSPVPPAQEYPARPLPADLAAPHRAGRAGRGSGGETIDPARPLPWMQDDSPRAWQMRAGRASLDTTDLPADEPPPRLSWQGQSTTHPVRTPRGGLARQDEAPLDWLLVQLISPATVEAATARYTGRGACHVLRGADDAPLWVVAVDAASLLAWEGTHADAITPWRVRRTAGYTQDSLTVLVADARLVPDLGERTGPVRRAARPGWAGESTGLPVQLVEPWPPVFSQEVARPPHPVRGVRPHGEISEPAWLGSQVIVTAGPYWCIAGGVWWAGAAAGTTTPET